MEQEHKMDEDGDAGSQRGAQAGKGKLLKTPEQKDKDKDKDKDKAFGPAMLPCLAGELEVEYLQG